MELHEIWVEGHGAQGSPGPAQLIATIEAGSWSGAVLKWLANDYNSKDWGDIKYKDGHYYLWGCRLFDNEADARKRFG